MKKLSLLLLLTCAFFAQNALAGGFPIGKNHILLVPTYSYYNAKAYWDRSGTYHKYDNNGDFTSHYFGLYGGFGLSNRFDVVFNLPYSMQSSNQNNITSTNSGMGDATLGLTYFISHFDGSKHLSISGSGIFPLYTNPSSTANKPYLGFQEYGSELKVGFAGSAKNENYAYYDFEVGARKLFSDYGTTQLFANLTAGIPLSKKWKASVTVSGLSSSSNQDTFDPNNLKANRDFGYVKINGAIAYNINKKVSIWANGYMDIGGQNIGQGRGFMAFLVFRL